uniref:Uncharacterized protein n=1 Tax=Grammatophora oceanica TaxID=210454 RepID=A0A7S1YB40_9STRA
MPRASNASDVSSSSSTFIPDLLESFRTHVLEEATKPLRGIPRLYFDAVSSVRATERLSSETEQTAGRGDHHLDSKSDFCSSSTFIPDLLESFTTHVLEEARKPLRGIPRLHFDAAASFVRATERLSTETEQTAFRRHHHLDSVAYFRRNRM